MVKVTINSTFLLFLCLSELSVLSGLWSNSCTKHNGYYCLCFVKKIGCYNDFNFESVNKIRTKLKIGNQSYLKIRICSSISSFITLPRRIESIIECN